MQRCLAHLVPTVHIWRGTGEEKSVDRLNTVCRVQARGRARIASTRFAGFKPGGEAAECGRKARGRGGKAHP